MQFNFKCTQGVKNQRNDEFHVENMKKHDTSNDETDTKIDLLHFH
jgi:hypothetical protein